MGHAGNLPARPRHPRLRMAAPPEMGSGMNIRPPSLESSAPRRLGGETWFSPRFLRMAAPPEMGSGMKNRPHVSASSATRWSGAIPQPSTAPSLESSASRRLRGETWFSPRLLRALRIFAVSALSLLSAHATTYYVTIAGLGGEPDYDQRFKMWAE